MQNILFGEGQCPLCPLQIRASFEARIILKLFLSVKGVNGPGNERSVLKSLLLS